MSALVDIAEWLRRLGFDREGGGALECARRDLRRAEGAHSAQVKRARREVARAQKRHARLVHGAERELRAAERAEESGLERARAVVAAARQSKELARFGSFLLTDEAIQTPIGRVALSARVRAFVEPGATLVAMHQASVMRLTGQGGTQRGVSRGLERHSERLYLLVESPELVCLSACSSNEAQARRFAELVNVAALNADDFARRRTEAVRGAEAEVQRLEERRAATVSRAKAKLREVDADTEAVEAARRELERIEADTGEVERRRADLRRLEDAGGDGAASA